MQQELLNLLPPERARQLRRDYYVRLATIGVAMVGIAILAAGALLVPPYLSVHQDMQSRQKEIVALDTQLAAKKGQETNQRLSTLTSTATYLSRLATTTTATGAIRGVLAVPRSGIVLTGITYAPPVQKDTGKMMLSGSAATRESLRAYVASLGTLPFIKTVDLPISAYAKEKDIQFTITLIGSLAP